MEFVYLAINKRIARDAVKIGRTRDVPKRMKDLSSASGVIGKYVCLCSCATNSAQDARTLEKKLHEIFSDYRDEKEFFTVDWLVAAGVLITLVLEKERKGAANPELAKWLRRELVDGNSIGTQRGNTKKPPQDGAPLPGSASEIERRRDDYMKYVKKNVSTDRTRDLQQLANTYDNRLRCLAEVLGIPSAYNIISVDDANNIYRRLLRHGDLAAINKKHFNGGMGAAMGHYVKFLRVSQKYDPTPETGRRRDAYMKYIKKNVHSQNPPQRARRCDVYLRHLAENVLIIPTIYDITSIEKADEIYRRLLSNGDLSRYNQKYCAGGMSAAMGHYVDFLRKNK